MTAAVFSAILNLVTTWSITVYVIVGLVSSVNTLEPGVADGLVGPTFTTVFPRAVVYGNSRGLVLPCRAFGRPSPVISWTWTNGIDRSELVGVPSNGNRTSEVQRSPGIVDVLANGSLHMMAFQDTAYNDKLHSGILVRCTASNSVGTVVSKEIQIKAVLSSRYQTFTVRVNDVYVTIGNTAVVQCSVDPYYVRDYVTVTSWTQNGVILKTDDRFSIMSNGDLHIREVTAEDGFKSLRCTTTNQLTGDKRTSGPSTLYVIESVNSPPIMKEAPTYLSVKRGSRVELPCAASGYPLPWYSWSRDGNPVIPSTAGSNITTRRRVRLMGGNLVLDVAAVDDAGEYICTSENSLGSKSTPVKLEIVDDLEVHVDPAIQIIDVGRTAVFSCHVSGSNGDPVNLVWFKDGVSLIDSAAVLRVSTITSENGRSSSLHVTSLERQDAGMYQCLAANEKDNAQAASRLLIGAARPHIFRRFDDLTFATSGSSVSLSCTAAGNPTPEITWSLDGKPLTEQGARYSVGSYVTSEGDVIGYVNITRVTLVDGGHLTCTAQNRAGTDHFEGQLFIYGIPHVKPIQNVTAVAGGHLSLHCYVSGFPVHSITWSKGVSSLPVNHRQLVRPNGTLYIDEIDHHVDEGWYSCDARDAAGQGMSRNVYVTVLEPPMIDSFSFPRRKQLDRVSVSCVVSQGDLPIDITWYKDGTPLPGQLGIVIQKTGDYSSLFSVSSVDQRHSGNYTCVATNAASSTEYTAQLHVDTPSWLSEPQNSAVVLGHQVVIECRAAGDPSPSVTWKKDYSGNSQKQRGSYRELNITDELGRVLVSRDGSLSIDGAVRHDAGYYLCQAGNGVGSDLSKVLHLNVHIPANVRDHISNYTVLAGESVDLECIAEGDLPLSVAWSSARPSIDLQNNERLKQSYFEAASDEDSQSGSLAIASSPVSVTGSRGSRLTVSRARREDSGYYMCTTQNEFGSDTVTVQLLVLEAPDSPVNVALSEITGRTMTLSWNVDFDGNSPVTATIIRLYDTTDITDSETIPAKSVRVDGSAYSFTVNNLHPAVSYSVVLAAENIYGLSNFSAAFHATTLEEEPSAAPVNVSVISTSSQTIRVFWKPPPANHHNGRLMGYYIGYKRHNSSAPYRYVGKPVQQETCDLSDLDKFTVYLIHIQAYNTKGPGPRSDDVIVMTLEDVPSQPPTDVSAKALTSQSLYVVWSPPPPSTIHGVLQGYQVLYRSVRDDEDETGDMIMTTTDRIATIYGLRKFTNYSVQVLALTRVGQGIACRPLFIRTLADYPDMPADIKAVAAGPTSILVAWRAPLHINGVLTKYTVRMQDLTDPRTPVVSTDFQSSTQSFLVTNLSVNYRYGFVVGANTEVGQGELTRQVATSTVDRVSAKIASFSLKMNARGRHLVLLPCVAVGIPQPSIKWKFGTSDVILNDRVQLLSNGSLTIDNVRSTDAGDYTCRAENEDSADEIIVSLTVQAPPQAPVLSVVMTTSSSIQVVWRAGSNGGSPIQGFAMYARREHDGGDPTWRRFGPTNRSFVASNLRCGSRYSFVLRAFNRIGEGRSSETVDARTNGSAPIMPPQSMLLYDVNVTSAKLAMDAWETGGCVITSFDVDLQVMGDHIWKNVQRNISPNVTFYDVIDLHPSTWYAIRVTAHNDAGSTESLLRFSTRSYLGGGVVLPPPRHSNVMFFEDEVDVDRSSRPFYERIELVVPVFACAVAAFVLCIGVIICRRRKLALMKMKTRQASAFKVSQDHFPNADKSKIHGVAMGYERHDVAHTYVAEPCTGRRAGRDVNTLPSLPSHGTNDVITSGMPRLLTESTSDDDECNESYSDAESDPYIFRDSRSHQDSEAANIGDVGDSGTDDVIGSNNRNNALSRPAGMTGACSSLSSGTTDDEGNINPYAMFPQYRTVHFSPQHIPQDGAHSADHQLANNVETSSDIQIDQRASPSRPLPSLLSTSSPPEQEGVGQNSHQCRLPSDSSDSQYCVLPNSKVAPPPPIRRTPSLRAPVHVNMPVLPFPPVVNEGVDADYLSPRPSTVSTFSVSSRPELTSSLPTRTSVSPLGGVSPTSRQHQQQQQQLLVDKGEPDERHSLVHSPGGITAATSRPSIRNSRAIEKETRGLLQQ